MSVYAIGNGKINGELGTGTFEEKLDPTLLESIKGRVVELKACESNALAITGTPPFPPSLIFPRALSHFSRLRACQSAMELLHLKMLRH